MMIAPETYAKWLELSLIHILNTETRNVVFGTELKVEDLETDGYKVVGGQGITIGTENNVCLLYTSVPCRTLSPRQKKMPKTLSSI